ncbi:HAD-IIIC family phosphatase [bacterium]|nr:HAD-IIIC family phosphatase [bacterium]
MKFFELQKKISELYEDQNASTGDFLEVAREFPKTADALPPYARAFKAAFLGGFTIQGLPETTRAMGIFHNIFLEVYSASYNQFSQEMLDSASALYVFRPDITFLVTEESDFLDTEHAGKVVSSFLEHFSGKLVIVNASTEGKLADVFKEFAESSRVFVFDFDGFLRRIGREKYWKTKFAELGDFRLSPDAFPLLAEELLGYAIAFSGVTKKCLVLDLDNTLWKGVAGEDGLSGVVPDAPLQEYILSLRDRGIILAVNSKNNPEDAFEIFDKHPDMRIRKEHVTAWRVNWNDKAANMRELAEEMGIGTDSFAFLDDSPFEQELVRVSLPEIAVAPISELRAYKGFESFALTPEDKRRAEMYEEEKKRKSFQESAGTLSDFLKELGIAILVEDARDETISRVSQLTQKTNQFNLTTRRYIEEAIREHLEKGSKVWTVRAKDRFGDYGIVGVAIICPREKNSWHIDSLLLSCRILGRGVPEAFLSRILRKLHDLGARACSAEFIPTAKNKPCETFLPSCGFEERESGVPDTRFYYYNLEKGIFNPPEYITIGQF